MRLKTVFNYSFSSRVSPRNLLKLVWVSPSTLIKYSLTKTSFLHLASSYCPLPLTTDRENCHKIGEQAGESVEQIAISIINNRHAKFAKKFVSCFPPSSVANQAFLHCRKLVNPRGTWAKRQFLAVNHVDDLFYCIESMDFSFVNKLRWCYLFSSVDVQQCLRTRFARRSTVVVRWYIRSCLKRSTSGKHSGAA